MISVIVYGRNDTHGYNLQKRAALFFNCLGLQLQHADDEIIFVDCNTEDALPTFPEAIADILTPAARRLLRVIRIRPAQFRKALPDSALHITEALSRNVGLRRSNPDNRFVLSTNTDMIFVPKPGRPHLSESAAGLGNRYGLLPRFDVPEWLWESLDRMQPETAARAVTEWSARFALHEFCRHEHDILFDSPGDFQLAPRAALFAMHGFDERMIWGWHVDANLCRRLFLKLGAPADLSDQMEGYHLNHNLQGNLFHNHDLPKNDFLRFYEHVNQAEVPEQAETWGLARENLEEIRLPSRRFSAFVAALGTSIPSIPNRVLESLCTRIAFNENLYYEPSHVFPYAANFLGGLEPGAKVAYWGFQTTMVTAFGNFLNQIGEGRELWVGRELSRINPALDTLGDPVRVMLLPEFQAADIFLLDFHLDQLESPRNPAGAVDPLLNPANHVYCKAFLIGLMELIEQERKRLRQGETPRRFVLLGHQHTLYEEYLQKEMSITVGAYACHVHYGAVKPQPSAALEIKAAKADVTHVVPREPPVVEEKRSWAPVRADRKIGFNIIGYVTSSTGLGVVARNTARLLQDLGYPVALLDVDVGLNRSGKELELAHLMADADKPLPHGINVFHMNPFELGLLLRKNHSAIRLGDCMNICVPFWELSRIPGNWVPALESMDMVLAPTHFIQDAVAASLNRTAVRYYPQAIEPLSGIPAHRIRWGIPEEALVFGFSFDFTSVFDRKNPVAVVQAFLQMFTGRRDVVLVIKMNHSQAMPAYTKIAERIGALRAAHPNLVVVDASLPYREVLELMACWDVYVSLHRAEGLGLGLMECMSMGKAAMATAWSGNMDFMDDCNSVLVRYNLVGVDPASSYNFCLNGETSHVWADPDVAEAALWMKRLADDPDLRRRLGTRARADMEARYRVVSQGEVFQQVERFHEQWNYRRHATHPVGPRASGNLRVLFQNRPSAEMAPGGDTVVMNRYRAYLESQGVSIDVIHDDSADPAHYDLVHLYNLVLPKTIEPLARRAHTAGTPYVVQAFQENQSFYLGRSVALYRLLVGYMQKNQDKALLPRYLELMRLAESMPTDTSAYAAQQARAVICSSREERDFLLSLHPSAQALVCHYGAEISPAEIGPELFEKAFGLRDFVLCVGRLEIRKNQLALLAALEDEDIPIVFADGGICYTPDYANVCHLFRRKGRTVYTGRLSKEMLVSAYRAAKAHVLPSWYELPGLVTLEAALYGCNVAASPHGGIRDYLGDTCLYFEPEDLQGMRRAVLRAMETPKSENAAHAARQFTWEKSGEKILRLYQTILSGKNFSQPETLRPALAVSR